MEVLYYHNNKLLGCYLFLTANLRKYILNHIEQGLFILIPYKPSARYKWFLFDIRVIFNAMNFSIGSKIRGINLTFYQACICFKCVGQYHILLYRCYTGTYNTILFLNRGQSRVKVSYSPPSPHTFSWYLSF